MNNNENNINEINIENLETVAGGRTHDAVHDLNNYVSRTVYNLPKGTYLVMQKTARGAFLNCKYTNGDRILVHKSFYEAGYYLAYSYEKDLYGFVDASYIH